MAYDKDKVYEQAKEAIEKHKLFFIDDIVAFLPIAKSTFYEWKLEQSEQLKAMLEKNRIELKVSMRSKWYKSNAPALQMALMKLICNDDERKMLSMTHTDVTSGGKTITSRYDEMSVEEMEAELERVKKL